MREIKFRGKRIDNGEWVYGQYYNLDNTSDWIIDTFQDSCGNQDFNHVQINPKTLGQYTGLKDKNGKEIYEGDKDLKDRIVILKDGCFWLHDKYRGDQFLYAVCKNIEIIGNIHEEII